jgi:hypothetical protein
MRSKFLKNQPHALLNGSSVGCLSRQNPFRPPNYATRPGGDARPISSWISGRSPRSPQGFASPASRPSLTAAPNRANASDQGSLLISEVRGVHGLKSFLSRPGTRLTN